MARRVLERFEGTEVDEMSLEDYLRDVAELPPELIPKVVRDGRCEGCSSRISFLWQYDREKVVGGFFFKDAPHKFVCLECLLHIYNYGTYAYHVIRDENAKEGMREAVRAVIWNMVVIVEEYDPELETPYMFILTVDSFAKRFRDLYAVASSPEKSRVPGWVLAKKLTVRDEAEADQPLARLVAEHGEVIKILRRLAEDLQVVRLWVPAR